MDKSAGKPHKGQFVSYLRVSTDRQGRSGLGLEAQREAIKNYLNGGEWELLGEFVEVESGRMKRRPQLIAALDLAKKNKAKLIIAKIDRLYRNVAATATLMESGVKFICCDMPEADEFMMHIMAAVAQREAKLISERTTAALRVVKRRGVKLGNPDPEPAAAKGRKVLIKQADDYATKVMPIVRELNRQGYTTLREIARGLSRRGVETRRGSTTWYPSQVANLLKRKT